VSLCASAHLLREFGSTATFSIILKKSYTLKLRAFIPDTSYQDLALPISSVPALRFWPLTRSIPVRLCKAVRIHKIDLVSNLSSDVMSSLKDIMDVDVEPLESQAYRRSREAAQEQASRPPIALSSETPSPSIDDDDNKGKTPLKRRRSNRVSKPPSQPTAARQNSTRRRSSAAGEGMEPYGFQAGASNQASNSGSPQQSSRGSEPATDMPVKYTPVTGRISRAKKGVPVHTCDICRPVKVC
jgi:hypothetical protein